MENAVDAFKIAFGMFVFALALVLTFSLVSQAKSTADTVLYYSDETNFYEHSKSSSSNREVPISEVIPTLYRYYKESVGVTINLKSGDTYTFDLNNKEDIFIGKNKLTSEADRKANLEKFILEKFINEELFILSDDPKFKEDFVEIPISGIYEYGLDGSELVLSSGGKKVYITYTEI